MKSTSTNPCSSPAPLLEAFFPTIHIGDGLACRVHLSETERIALLNLEQMAEDKAEHLLSSAEQDYIQRFRYPKRRREWLGGRLAAKAVLLNTLATEECQRLTILPDAHGKPTVSGLTDSNLSLSLSHSGSYAVALAAYSPSCGIDLQELSDKLPSLTKYFAAAPELALLAGQQSRLGRQKTALTMLWAVKEAMKKSLLADQPAIFSGIEAEEIRSVGENIWQFSCAVQGHLPQTALAYDFSPYILALTKT